MGSWNAPLVQWFVHWSHASFLNDQVLIEVGGIRIPENWRQHWIGTFAAHRPAMQTILRKYTPGIMTIAVYTGILLFAILCTFAGR